MIARQEKKEEEEEGWIITEHALSHALGRQSKTTREGFSSIVNNNTRQRYKLDSQDYLLCFVIGYY